MTGRSLAALVLLALALGGGACTRAAPAAETPAGAAGSSTAALRGEVIVSAASSLTEAFADIGREFEAERSGTRVALNFASSAALATQIREGAPVGVFASADEVQMQNIVDAGRARAPRLFASNALVVAVPDRDAVVTSYADLAHPGVRLVLASAEVPAGRYARQSLDAAQASAAYGANFRERVLANVRSEEANVRAVLSKVQLEEADAGIVYRTDIAAAAGEVIALPVPSDVNVPARYPIATIEGYERAELARAFVDFVLSTQGQAILSRHGFGPPG